jgi:uncharacterized protein (DUF983 family)
MLLKRDIPPSLRNAFSNSSSGIPDPEANPVKNIKDVISCGMKRICPHCRKVKMFRTYFHMYKYCPNCGVKYEREAGEYIVAMYINILLTEVLFIAGYLLTDFFFGWPVWIQITIWASFNAFFPMWFYPRSKALWAAGLELGGGLYRD